MHPFEFIKNISHCLRRFLLTNGRREYVFILGMHRSGTSSLAGMLKCYGLYLGGVSIRNPYNPKGNQEGYATLINEALLKANGGTWDNPVNITRVPWKQQLRIEKLRMQMTVDLMRNKRRKWGVKDPRMLFCLPAWEEKDIRYIGTFRHPINVCRSLEQRNDIRGNSTKDWMNLWYRYNYNLIQMYQKNPFPIVNFDWESERYRQAIRNIANAFELNTCDEDFFDDRLRNQRTPGRIESSKHRSLYDQLVEISEIEEKKCLKRLS